MLRSRVFHRCQWVSTSPGATIIPRASSSRASGAPRAAASSPAPTAAMRPLVTRTSPSGMSPSPGSMVSTYPDRMMRSSLTVPRAARASGT